MSRCRGSGARRSRRARGVGLGDAAEDGREVPGRRPGRAEGASTPAVRAGSNRRGGGRRIPDRDVCGGNGVGPPCSPRVVADARGAEALPDRFRGAEVGLLDGRASAAGEGGAAVAGRPGGNYGRAASGRCASRGPGRSAGRSSSVGAGLWSAARISSGGRSAGSRARSAGIASASRAAGGSAGGRPAATRAAARGTAEATAAGSSRSAARGGWGQAPQRRSRRRASYEGSGVNRESKH